MREIVIFKTKCKLPDKTIGEACKKLPNDEYLVCNKDGWWICSKQWINKYRKKIK